MHTSKFTDAKDMKYLQIIKVYQNPCSQLIVKGCSRSWLPCSRMDVSLAGRVLAVQSECGLALGQQGKD